MVALLEPGRKKRPRIIHVSGGMGGKGGGGSSAAGATQDPDTVRSRTNIKILLAISEGQIAGIAYFKRGIRFNGTPLQDASGFTFTGSTNSTDMVTRTSGTAFIGGHVGRDISGGSIPLGATIIKVVSASVVQISVPATATASGLAIAVSGGNNFKNYRIYFMPGTQDQNYIPAFTDASTLTQVGFELKHDTPWVVAITNSDADRVRVTVRYPRLQKQDTKTGSIHGAEVELKFELNSGGGYVQVIDDELNAMSANGYDRTFMVPLPKPMPVGGWSLRVTRVTPDSTNEALQNTTQVLTYSEVTDAKLRYPNTALLGIEMDTQNFGTEIPVVTLDVVGLYVQVPTNYDPVARTYATTGAGTTAGAWDGTFKLAYTRNPTWHWRDIIITNRYGLGGLINASYIDKFALYTIAQYCDQLVPNEFGGTEPRFSGDLYITGQEEAIKVLQNMASVFRALTYYSVGLIVPVQDKPYTSIAYQFSPENVIEGKFVYAGSGKSGRHTQAVVWWSDKNDSGTMKPELVEDKDAVALYGVNKMEITAFGCTSRGQAHRLGKWSLLTEQIDNDTVSFASGYEAMILRPGDVIQIQDPFRSGRTLSGRTHSATASSITLDKPVVVESGKTYQLCTLKTDGTIQTNNITNGAGTYTVLNISGTFGQTPLAETVWILSVSDLVPELWRILSNIPNEKHQCQIIALKYNASKFAAADDLGELEFPPTSVLPNPNFCQPPTNLTIEELAIVTETSVQRALKLDWTASPESFLRDYEVRLRVNDGNWELQPPVTGNSIVININTDGDYDAQVLAVNVLGARSTSITASYTVDDANPLPYAQVSGLELMPDGANGALFTGRDCNVTWRVNSRARAKFFWADPMVGMWFDPYFACFEAEVIRLTDNAIIYREKVYIPIFSFSIEKNIKANGGVPLAHFKSKVRVKDSFGNLSSAESITVTKTPPTELPHNITASGVTNGITIAWDKPLDLSITKINFYLDVNPFYTPTWPIAVSVAADSTVKTITGLNNGQPYYLYVQSEDCYGQRTNIELCKVAQPGFPANADGYETFFSPITSPIVPGIPAGVQVGAIPAVTMDPAPPNSPSAGVWGGVFHVPGWTDAELIDSNTDKQIYFTLSTTIPSPGAGGTFLYAGTMALNGAETLTAVAYYLGTPGPARTFVFVLAATGVVTPGFNPPAGTYYSDSGTKDVTVATPTPSALMFYTTDGITTPAHSGPNATPPTKLISATSKLFTLPAGKTIFKVIGYRSGWTDSGIMTAVYNIIKSKSHPPPVGGGGGGGPLP